jgi:hypothetical protein
MTHTLEQRMVFAHKEGAALAKFCISEEEIRRIAADRFGISDEHDAMIAGFLGQIKRTQESKQ